MDVKLRLRDRYNRHGGCLGREVGSRGGGTGDGDVGGVGGLSVGLEAIRLACLIRTGFRADGRGRDRAGRVGSGRAGGVRLESLTGAGGS